MKLRESWWTWCPRLAPKKVEAENKEEKTTATQAFLHVPVAVPYQYYI